MLHGGRRSVSALTFFLAVTAGVLAAGNPASADDAGAGRRLARKVCSACHVVAADQETPPLLRPPAPSFAAIANRPDTTPQSIERFLADDHPRLGNAQGMPNPELTQDQARQAAAFLMTLKAPR